LAKNTEILSRTYTDDRVSVHCRVPRKFLGQLAPEKATIKLRLDGSTSGSMNGHMNNNGHESLNGHADPESTYRDDEPIDEVA
jgi:hypothetical protein